MLGVDFALFGVSDTCNLGLPLLVVTTIGGYLLLLLAYEGLLRP